MNTKGLHRSPVPPDRATTELINTMRHCVVRAMILVQTLLAILEDPAITLTPNQRQILEHKLTEILYAGQILEALSQIFLGAQPEEIILELGKPPEATAAQAKKPREDRGSFLKKRTKKLLPRRRIKFIPQNRGPPCGTAVPCPG